METTTIVYGPTYTAEMSAIVGTQFNNFNKSLRQIDQCVHTGRGTMQEYHTYLNIETGKVFKVIDNGISYSKVILFDSVQAYQTYSIEMRKLERDPETLRYR